MNCQPTWSRSRRLHISLSLSLVQAPPVNRSQHDKRHRFQVLPPLRGHCCTYPTERPSYCGRCYRLISRLSRPEHSSRTSPRLQVEAASESAAFSLEQERALLAVHGLPRIIAQSLQIAHWYLGRRYHDRKREERVGLPATPHDRS
jgi:hypothetical protein